MTLFCAYYQEIVPSSHFFLSCADGLSYWHDVTCQDLVAPEKNGSSVDFREKKLMESCIRLSVEEQFGDNL